jgi:signal transduction histidine kinase/putative methionine-R-sulfoxide reductase with GAF domain
MSLDDITTHPDSALVGEDLKKIYDSGIALISSKKQLNEVLKVIAESVLEVFSADIVTLYQYDQKRDEFMGFPVTIGHLYQPEFVRRKPGQNDVAYQVVRKKANYYSEDVINDPVMSRKDYPRTEGTKEHFIFREKVLSSAAILLKQDKEVVGVMFINYRRFVQFSKEKQYLMDIYASYAAIAIKNARDKEELTKKLTFSLAEIYNIRERIEDPYTIDQEAGILLIVLTDILDFLDEEIGYFAEYESGTKRLTVKLASKLYQDLVTASWDIERGITGYAIKTQQVQYIPDSSQNEHFFRFSDGTVKGFQTDADKDVKSSFTVPLILGNHILGVFQFESKNIDGFSEYDREIIKTMTVQAVNAIQNVRLLQEKELARRKINALHKLDNLIGRTWKLELVFKYIMKNAIDLVKSSRSKGHISIIEEIDGKSHLVPHAISGYPNLKKMISLDQEKGITRLAVLENRTINVTDSDDLWKKHYFTIIPGMRSELAVPLKVRGHSIGVLNIESPYPKAFDKEDQELLETLAGQAVIVIMVTRLIEDIKNIGLSGSTKSKTEFLELILSKACELLGANIGAIWLYDSLSCSFQFGAYLGVEINLWQDMKLTLDNSFVGHALKKREIIAAHIEDLVKNSGEFSRKNFIILSDAGLKSIISTPFIAGEDAIGVMNIYSRDEIDIKKWNASWEKSLLELFSAQASIALQNFKRYAELENAKTKIEQSVNKITFDNMRQMLRLVTHRLNNSVGNIRADAMELLDRRSEFDKTTVKMLQDIQESAQEALGIPIELNNFIKKLKSDKTEVKVYEIIRGILKEKEFKGIQINFDRLKNAPRVKANYGLLTEVFTELIQNATKAMPDGGEIIISAQTVKPKMLEIKVKDTGHGIARENLPRVFEYAFTHWKAAKGQGDGLAIVKTVIEVDHKGEISIESEEGKGCTVKLSLPLSEELKENRHESARQGTRRRG